MAGLFGVMGLIFLYAAMSKGLMSIAAPVSALLAALIPVIVGIVTQGLPNYLILVGFVFALLSIWVISQGEDGIKNIRSHLVDLKLPLLAGLGFGCYFVFVHQATGAGGVIWPMVISRVASVSFLLIYMLITKTSFQLEKATVLPAIFLNGILDLTGNGFFILATQTGRLDVAAVLSSLFPGATVLLASIFLKERLNRNQWVGVVSALIAIVLMTM